jgi:hypothetical protein
MIKSPDSDRFAEFGIRDFPIMWHVFAGLGIKDFHVDMASLMDSIAPVVTQVKGDVAKKAWSSGFSTVQTKGQYRNGKHKDDIPSDICKTIDQTDRWWPVVKEVRDILVHREHQSGVFERPSDGILFQVYEGLHDPQILDQRLMYAGGHNVIDFSLYSAFVLAEVLTFLDELGTQIAAHLNIGSMVGSLRIGDFKSLVSSLERLASSTS